VRVRVRTVDPLSLSVTTTLRVHCLGNNRKRNYNRAGGDTASLNTVREHTRQQKGGNRDWELRELCVLDVVAMG